MSVRAQITRGCLVNLGDNSDEHNTGAWL